MLDLLIQISNEAPNGLSDQDLREEIDTFAFGVYYITDVKDKLDNNLYKIRAFISHLAFLN